MQTDACTALDWVTGLFFQSGRLLGLIMQAIATVIGADLGGFADEFGEWFAGESHKEMYTANLLRAQGNLREPRSETREIIIFGRRGLNAGVHCGR